MKAADIFKGQIYVTEMLNRFSSERKPLNPIKVLDNVEGFIIFKRDGVKQAVYANSFISVFIKACSYKLKTKDFEYKGYLG